MLSRYTVLPWEDAAEYRALVAALAGEHAPQGPTEEHLVEEIAGILWRKRRLRLAEAAAHRRGLEGTLSPRRNTDKVALVHLGAVGQSEGVAEAIRGNQGETAEDIAEIDEDEGMTRRTLALLGSGRNDAYKAALAALREDTRQWWEERLARDAETLGGDGEPAIADGRGAAQVPRRRSAAVVRDPPEGLFNRPLIREQAFGEALDPDKLQKLARYEVHLDRKLERMLSMLLRLKELRRRPRWPTRVIRFAKSTREPSLRCRSWLPEFATAHEAACRIRRRCMSEWSPNGGRWWTLADARFSDT